MNQEINNIWKKANSLKGCLGNLKKVGGRRKYNSDEDPLSVDDLFISDEAKLLNSKTYRTMSDKTQVFTLSENSLIRTRKTHTNEVVAVSIVTSELLGLNTNLVRAASLGHDIGHVPFGHQGESWMAQKMGRPEFCHEVMSSIVAQKIERKGRGLNLTFETLEAMMRHSGNKAKEGMSQEAWVLRYTDKFAYIFHDINDIIIRARFPVSKELLGLINLFGETQRERTTTAIAGLIIESSEVGYVSFEKSDLGKKFNQLRTLMYGIYPRVTQQNMDATMEPVLEFLTHLKIGDPFLILALMTDKDVLRLASEPMRDMGVFNQTSISEIIPHIESIGPIDLCNPYMDW